MTASTSTPSVLSRGSMVEDHRDEYKKEALRKGKCLSIGIQVFMRTAVEEIMGFSYIHIMLSCVSVFLHFHFYSQVSRTMANKYYFDFTHNSASVNILFYYIFTMVYVK